MERREGCCIAGYGGGGGGDATRAWQMGRIMLRFRPIAPKPAAMAPSPAPAASGPACGGGRGKRKAANASGGKRGRRPKKAAVAAAVKEEKSPSSPSSSSSGMTSVDSSPRTLLALMPESPDAKEVAAEAPKTAAAAAPPPPPPQVVVPLPLRPAASWVTVEGVTETWLDGEAGPPMPPPGGVSHVAGGEAPAFVSDQWERVTWTNASFNRMVTGGDASAEVRVGLATKGAVPAWGACAGFTCRVRVRYACPQLGRGSLAAPCDVWRLGNGAFIWRLDIQAALGLGVSLLP